MNTTPTKNSTGATIMIGTATAFSRGLSRARPLRRYPEVDGHSESWDEPAERTTTWWCAGCGGIDAPQPCLGICIWRPIDWVNANLYGRDGRRAVAERDMEMRLR